jgi:hypothetical protein
LERVEDGEGGNEEHPVGEFTAAWGIGEDCGSGSWVSETRRRGKGTEDERERKVDLSIVLRALLQCF